MPRFSTLASRYRDRIYAFACAYLGDSAEAEDVAQEVLVRLWEHHRRLDPDRLGAWVTHVTRNACIDAYRRRRAYRNAVATDSEAVAFRLARADGPLPDRAAEAAELRADIREAIDRLDEPYRSIVILRELQDLKYTQISEALDLPLNTVKVYLHRGRKQLRNALRTQRTHASP